MITVDHLKNKTTNILELSNETGNSYAKINLNLGGSLQELKIEGKQILAKFTPLEYNTCYNASVLFPFANRINNGSYVFNNKEYHFKINEVANNNALHGLIFDKKFQLKNKKTIKDSTSVTIEYIEEKRNIGFPFTYKIQLIYTLSKKSISLKMNIENTDTTEFPFTIGWHPYFYSSNLEDSSLVFNADKKIIHNKKMITENILDSNLNGLWKLNNQDLDDCFHLKDSSITFKTPEYNLELKSDQENNYLQIYTPNNPNAIAIEPLTGISDSFNNKEGLQTLQPNTVFSTLWTVTKIN